MNWIVLALISAVLSAAAAITQKKILFFSDALKFSFILSLINIFTSLPLWYTANFENIIALNLFFLFLKTFIASIAFLNVMLALKNMEISGALPLMVLTPGIVAIFAFILLDESLSITAILGLLLLLLGTYILEVKEGTSFTEPFKIFYKSKKHHYIVTALICFTITAIMDKTIMVAYKFNPQTMVIFQQIFAVISFAIILIYKKELDRSIFRKIPKKTFYLIILISVFTISYRYFTFAAMKIAPVGLVLSIKRLSVLFASTIGGRLFQETNLLKKSIAVIILLAGVVLILNF